MRRLRRPGVAAVAVFAAAAVWLLSASLVGGKILSPNDLLYFTPPFAADRPAELERASNGHLGDATILFQPHLHQARELVRSGELPRWDPDIGAGRPEASQQGGLLYPLHWLAYVLPFWESLAWIAALKLLIAATGTYLLCRELGLRPAAGVFGGLAFAFGMALVVYLEHPQASVFSLLPWLLLAVERICRSGRLAPVLAFGGLIGAIVLAGHPESVVVASLGILGYALVRLVTEGRSEGTVRRMLVRRGLLIAGGFGLGVAAAAVLLVPFLEALTQARTTRVGGPLLDPSAAWSFFFPELWGRPDKVAIPAPDILAGRPFYFGALPFVFAAGGLAVRRTPVQLFFAGTFAVAALILFDTPVADALRLLPLLSHMAVRHFMFLMCFAGAMLAAFGLHHALTVGEAERRRMLVVIAAAAALPLLWIPLHVGALSEWRNALHELPVQTDRALPPDAISLGAVIRWGVLVLVGVGAVVMSHRRRRFGVGLAVFAIALTAADLVTLDRGYHPAVAKSLAVPRDPPEMATLERAASSSRVGGTGVALRPNISEYYDLHDVRQAELPSVKRHVVLYRALGGAVNSRDSITTLDLTRPRSDDLLDLFSVRYVYLDEGDPLPTAGYRTITNRPGDRLVENRDPLPRTFVAYGWRTAQGFAGALSATVARRPRELGRAPVIEGAGSAAATEPPTPAVVRREDATHVTIDAVARRRGQLVLTDTYYPGWTAKVDGREAKIRPANVAFRAVAVPPGRHTVTFTYDSWSFALGAIVSACTALLIAAGLLTAGVRARRRRRSVG